MPPAFTLTEYIEVHGSTTVASVEYGNENHQPPADQSIPQVLSLTA